VKDRPEPDTPAELRARALRLLARREHSRQELARKLAPHAESAEGVESLLSELQEKKQLSNERFAAERARVLSRKFGAARIRQELKSKGIPQSEIDRVSGEGDLERARAILERKYREPAATREERAKRMRFLQSRGFSSEIIFSLLSARNAD
jgi:regulatory protein